MLTACSGRDIKEPQVVYQSLPKALLSDCVVVEYQDSASLQELAQNASEALLAQWEEVAKCNSRLKQARDIQDKVEKIYGK